MKIIVFKGGLGNTIFEYAHYEYLKQKYPKNRFVSYFPTKALLAHNGFELTQRLKITLPPSTVVGNLIGFFFHNLQKLNKRLHIHTPLSADMFQPDNDSAIVHDDYFQNSKYIPPQFSMEFILPENLSDKNKKIIREIELSESVALHVRRGDYLNYTQYCILGFNDYYRIALDIVGQKMRHPKLFIFSDDIEWCRETFCDFQCTFIDWNQGEDSFLDMYLMTCCKAVIMANSTFSFWGACLNKNNPMVIIPRDWGNTGIKVEHLYRKGWIIV